MGGEEVKNWDIFFLVNIGFFCILFMVRIWWIFGVFFVMFYNYGYLLVVIVIILLLLYIGFGFKV